MTEKEITLQDLVEHAFEGLQELIEKHGLPEEKSSVAAFTIVYGVNTDDGSIEVGHSTPTDFRYDTPLVLKRVAEMLHEQNVQEIAENN